MHEVEVLAGLLHKNIIRLIGFAEELESGEAWIILSWKSNGDLRKFLATGSWEIPERISLVSSGLLQARVTTDHQHIYRRLRIPSMESNISIRANLQYVMVI